MVLILKKKNWKSNRRGERTATWQEETRLASLKRGSIRMKWEKRHRKCDEGLENGTCTL